MQLSREFKIRCSAIGKIMTEPQGKSNMQIYLDKKEQIAKLEKDIKDLTDSNKTHLKTFANVSEKLKIAISELPELERNKDKIVFSKTCLDYVHEWIKEQPEFYNRRIEFRSKYCDKGNAMESESIEFAAKYYGWGLVSKNTERKSNEFLEGEGDVILSNSVEDIKNSWSQKTFPLFSNEIPVDGYGWQLQGYCELYDKPIGGLIYTLMDALEDMIDKEAYYKSKELGLDEVPLDLYDEMKKHMTYSNLPDELRIKRFFVDRDKSKIELVYQRVEEIRNYIKSI